LDKVNYEYGTDAEQRIIKIMTEFEPSFKIPKEFFPGKEINTQLNTNGHDTNDVNGLTAVNGGNGVTVH
jgi:hypothetical protein